MLMAATRFLVAGALLYAIARLTSARGGAAADTAPVAGGGHDGHSRCSRSATAASSWAQQTVPIGIAALDDRVGRAVGRGARPRCSSARVSAGRRWSAVASVSAASRCSSTRRRTAGSTRPAPRSSSSRRRLGDRVRCSRAEAGRRRTCSSSASACRCSSAASYSCCVGIAIGERGDVHLSQFSARSLGGLASTSSSSARSSRSAPTGGCCACARTSLVATYAYVNPVVAVWLGWALLGEGVSARTLLAGGVIVAAVALIVSSTRRRPRSGSGFRCRSLPPRAKPPDPVGDLRAKRGSIACGSGYSRYSTSAPASSSTRRAARPNSTSMIGSYVPCPIAIGGRAQARDRARSPRPAAGSR